MHHDRGKSGGWFRALVCLAAALVFATAVPRAVADPLAYEPGLDPGLGFNLISWWDGTQPSHWISALNSLDAAGFTEVSISPVKFINTSGPNSGTLTSSGAPSLSGIRTAVDYAANTLGMKVTLNPFIEPQGFAFWRAQYNPSGDEATRFWNDYKAYLDEVADIAEDEGAAMMTVGTELGSLSQNSSFAGNWNTVINSVDGIFSGQIGYAANWDEYNHPTTASSIWEHAAIDFMGIDAYFPVSSFGEANQDPQPAGLDESVREDWDIILDGQILPFAQARQGGDGLPLVFTEYGLQPWNRAVRQHSQVDVGNLDTAEQVQGFDGLLRAMDHRQADDDFLAMHIWHWAMVGGDDNNWGMGLPGTTANFTDATQFLSDFVSGVVLPTDKYWASATSGDFGAAGSWTGGVPVAGEVAHFDVAGTYTVTFDNAPNPLSSPIENESLSVTAGTITFRSAGTDYTYHLTGDAALAGGALSLGASGDPLHLTVDNDLTVEGGATLNVNFDSEVNSQNLSIGQAGGNGTVDVNGSGSMLNASGSVDLGADNHTATLTYRNAAQGSLATAGTVNLAVSDTTNSVATINVLSDADVTAGHIAISTGFAFSTGTLNVEGAGSTVTQAGNRTLTVGADFSESGTVNIGTTESGATLSTGTGAITINPSGRINIGSDSTAGTLNANGNMSIYGNLKLTGGTLNAAGSITIQPGGSFTFEGGTLRATTVTGNVTNQGGTVAPGSSPGTTTINGNYTQQEGGALEIEIGGLVAGDDFDVLAVSGIATLDGLLNVSLFDEFAPSGGQQFTVLTAGNIVDNGLVLGGPAADLFTLLVGSSSVVLQALSTGLLGDYNGNDKIDAADYTTWRDALTAGATSLPNDPTPGTVDESDFLYWRGHFGETISSGTGAGAAAVPEPGTLAMLLAIGGPWFLGRCRVFTRTAPSLAAVEAADRSNLGSRLTDSSYFRDSTVRRGSRAPLE